MSEDQVKYEGRALVPEIVNTLPIPQGAGAPMMQIKTGYVTAVAVQVPRPTIDEIAAKVFKEAESAAGSFYYSWRVKKKDGGTEQIEGGSIDLAMSLARNYGNCVVDVEAVETVSHITFKGVFLDLETGFTCPRLYRQRKSQQISSKMDADRQEDMVYQIAQSKAIRNATLRAMPKWVIDEAIEIARASELQKIKKEPPEKARAKAIKFFAEYGITVDRIVAKFDGRTPDQWTPEDLLVLRESAASVSEGVKVSEIFPAPEPTASEPIKSGRPNNLDEKVKQHAQGGAAAGTMQAPPPSTPAADPKPQEEDVPMFLQEGFPNQERAVPLTEEEVKARQAKPTKLLQEGFPNQERAVPLTEEEVKAKQAKPTKLL